MGHRKKLKDLLEQAKSCRDGTEGETFFLAFQVEFEKLLEKPGEYLKTEFETGYQGFDLYQRRANIYACLGFKVAVDGAHETLIWYELFNGDFSAVISTYQVEQDQGRKRYRLLYNLQETLEFDEDLFVDEILGTTVATVSIHNLAQSLIALENVPASSSNNHT